ncbi:MAG TPA: hypothetical protein VED01_20335 [Burkholderiales bacterium]|nr:hypothetical protein [Burkholderiales bacterium]
MQQAAADADAKLRVPPSAWIEADKGRHFEIIRSASLDVLVLPFVMSGTDIRTGIDVSARTVMAYTTAQKLAHGGLRVVDVAHAARAAGEPRRISQEEALRIATSAARNLVLGEVAQSGDGRMSVTLTHMSTLPGSTSRSATRRDIPISDAITPELAYAAVADALLKELGLPVGAAADSAARERSSALEAQPLSEIAAASSDVLRGLWVQQLLGALQPHSVRRARQSAFERTLAAAEDVPESADKRLLKARALAQLGRRPAAVAVMRGHTRTPEERAMMAYLDGNLTALQRAVAEIERPIPRLIAELELVGTQVRYGLSVPEIEKTAQRLAAHVPVDWQPLIVWFVQGLSEWNVRDTLEVKVVLDAHFPVKGYSLAEAVRSKALSDARDERGQMTLQGLAFEHVHRVLAASRKAWAEQQPLHVPRPYDYLSLLAARAEATLLDLVDFVCCVQGRRDDALRLLDAMDEIVFHRGSPRLHYRKAELMYQQMMKLRESPERLGLAQQVYEHARRARQWNTTDPDLAARAMRMERFSGPARLPVDRPGTRTAHPDVNDLRFDEPPTLASLHWRDIFFPDVVDAYPARIERACAYSRTQAGPCDGWRRHLERAGDAQAARRVEKQHLVDRFEGSPRRLTLLINAAKERGDLSSAVAFARESLRANRDDWAGYEALGSLYRDAGDYEAAAREYRSWPRFRETEGNTVDISNFAQGVAEQFARRGALKQAREFYELAAAHPNGSNSSLAAAIWLALAEHRFGEAAQISESRVRRYPQPAAFERHLALLFALGESDRSWAVLREKTAREETFAPWRAAAIGLRAQAADHEKLAEWAKQNGTDGRPVGIPHPRSINAFTIAAQVLATDRPAESVDAIAVISSAMYFKMKPIDWSKVPPEHVARMKADLERGRPTYANGKMYIERFGDGYSALKRGDLQTAYQALQEWAEPPPPYSPADALYAMLPYHAYAAAKTGHRAPFLEYLERYGKPGLPDRLGNIRPAWPEFDAQLARAVLAALDGNHDTARAHLVLARAAMPAAGARPLDPQYVFAEICEILGTVERLPGYVAMGLDLAKAHQAYEPWAAWAYAYEARHSTREDERVRALAMAMYLDRNSWRASEADASLKRKAQAWLDAHKPFQRETVTRRRAL